MGGGGGGGSTQFKAQGAPPGFDYGTAMGLQQLAIGGDIQSYALSDMDFANRYPALQGAYNQYQAMLNQQVPDIASAQAGQGQIMQGLGGNILGRLGTQTTSDINALRAQAGTVASAAQPLFNLGATQAGMAQPVYNLGQAQAGYSDPIAQLGASQAGLAQPLINIGGQINRMGGQMAGMAATPYAMGQQLLQEPIDPQAQQQMMKAGLTSAAGALGAQSLGQGMAGQAAAARQLGLNTLQYGQAMRGEAMQDIGQAASILGQAGQLRGLGGQTMGLGGQQLTQGGQLYGLGAGQLGAGAQTMGLGSSILGQAGQNYQAGAGTAAQAGGLYGSAQNMQEQYGMNTAQMAAIYGGLQSQQAQQFAQNMGQAYNMFQKRPFGLGGTNLAQSELGQAGAYNSFQQANYATMNGIAYNQAQMNAQQNQLQAQQNAGMMSAGVGAATTAATTGATVAAMSCWVARTIYGTDTNKWKIFRHWLLNKAPEPLRSLYIKRGREFAAVVRKYAPLRTLLKFLMDGVIKSIAYETFSFA